MPNQGVPGYQGVGPSPGTDFGMGQQFGGKPGGGMQSGGDGWAPKQDWQERGFDSRDAAQSVSRQYGLVQQEGGGWGKPTADYLQSQMTSQGWGPDSNVGAGTPVGIGGARWMMGAAGNPMQYTGQASDSPFGGMPMGQAYDSGQQTPYGRQRPRRTRTFGDVM